MYTKGQAHFKDIDGKIMERLLSQILFGVELINKLGIKPLWTYVTDFLAAYEIKQVKSFAEISDSGGKDYIPKQKNSPPTDFR